MNDLSHHEKIALIDISTWLGSPFYWREKSMPKLAARGLVERHPDDPKAWRLTEAGKASVIALRKSGNG